MTEMTFDDFQRPSEIPGGGGGATPSFAQMEGRLVHIYPTARTDNVTSDYRKEPHTRLTVEMTFLDGTPIDRVLLKDGKVKEMLTPPIQPGQTMTGKWINYDWFTSRIADKVGQPGFPGIVGILHKGKSPKSGNDLWMLNDPTPQQMEQIKSWWTWKQQQPPGSTNYVPAPPAPPIPVAAPAQQYAPAPQQPASPFAPQQPAAAPVGSWQPTMPPGVQPAAQQPPPAPAPAPQPGPEVPPWQR